MTAENLMIIFATVVAFVLPIIIQFLKAKFGIESAKVKAIIAFGLSIVAGTIVSCATGKINFADLISFSNAENMVVAHAIVYSFSQVFYQTYLKPKLKAKTPIKVGLTD